MNSVTPRSFRMYSRLAFAIVSLGLAVQQPAMAVADAFDDALDKLVADAVKAVEESGKKKIAVLDFPDIAGANSAFGKYLAEQVSVGMVTAKKEFTIVDRANLRSILAEHQLTEEGLVKPENAKQLGEFSGVDALVLGTITSVNSGHIITVKILATDKAEIVGATKSKLPLNPDFDSVINTPVGGEAKTNQGKEKQVSVDKKADEKAKEYKNEYFSVKVKKLQLLKSGEVILTLDFLKQKNGQVVSVYLDGNKELPNAYHFSREEAQKASQQALLEMPTCLRSSSGEEYRLVKVVGISVYNSLYGTATVLHEERATTITLQFKANEKTQSVISSSTTFTLDCNVEIGIQSEGSYRALTNTYQTAGVSNVHIESIR